MAKVEMVRYTCNYCVETTDIPSGGAYPERWKQYAIRETAPKDDNQSQVIDLCPRHALSFLDHATTPNGPHRNVESAQ